MNISLGQALKAAHVVGSGVDKYFHSGRKSNGERTGGAAAREKASCRR